MESNTFMRRSMAKRYNGTNSPPGTGQLYQYMAKATQAHVAEMARYASDFFSAQVEGLDPEKPTVMIFGGSRGARPINEASIATLPMFKGAAYQVLFVTGQAHYEKTKIALRDVAVPDNVKVVPYIPDMPQILPEIDCIVGRAGATSLAEITALGIPTILIPSPYVTNDHQTKNALSLVKQDAALMIKEEDLNQKTLFANIQQIMQDEQKRQQMGQNARQAGVPDAANKVIAVLQEIMH